MNKAVRDDPERKARDTIDKKFQHIGHDGGALQQSAGAGLRLTLAACRRFVGLSLGIVAGRTEMPDRPRCLTGSPPLGQKEAQHLPRCIRPGRIRVLAGGPAARPLPRRMAEQMYSSKSAPWSVQDCRA
ncbi:hypothetical protein [uncultured Paracoccus sp.]|uniref:hypothetical protein n=1 Tax=uncultured Paracoccus sp. TaxID=189685 RepID=UPI00260936F2|nr:hypothetical protein [uncultured Paracoccus sp.]